MNPYPYPYPYCPVLLTYPVGFPVAAHVLSMTQQLMSVESLFMFSTVSDHKEG